MTFIELPPNTTVFAGLLTNTYVLSTSTPQRPGPVLFPAAERKCRGEGTVHMAQLGASRIAGLTATQALMLWTVAPEAWGK